MRGARIWSDGAVRAGADTLAVADGRILALGRETELSPLVGPDTRTLDAAGATVSPGLVDAHVHLVSWALTAGQVPLADCTSRDEVISRVSEFVARDPGGAPLVGRGWDANGWTEAPERSSLDRVSGTRPVLLHSRDFHALWVNSAALAICGITRETPDPAGGRIVRDAAGEPTGLLQEHAAALCGALLPVAEAGDRTAVSAVLPSLHALGVTGVHDFEGPAALRVLNDVCAREGPRLRVLMHLTHAGLDQAIGLGIESGLGNDTFRIGAVKLFADGTLGSRTAAMLAPYEGTAESGMDLIPPAELGKLVHRATKAGLAIAIHAIGDRAVRSALDALEASAPALARLALPSRIEHVQLADPADLPRFAKLGVAASMQPSHAISDAALADRHWGARVANSYPWRALLGRGVLLAFGSDAPVEPPDPAEGLRAAVTREVSGRSQPFTPHQRLTLDEALTAYTEGPSRLGGTWPRVGTLRAGAAADLVVWNADLHALPAARLGSARAAATVIAGRLVWNAATETPAARFAGSAR